MYIHTRTHTHTHTKTRARKKIYMINAGEEAEKELAAFREKALEDELEMEHLRKQIAAVREEALDKYLELNKEATAKSTNLLAERDNTLQVCASVCVRVPVCVCVYWKQ
jgi:hypothetical protein